MNGETAIIAASVGVICWAIGFVTECRRKAQRAVKRANSPIWDYDRSNPINQRTESRYLGRSEFGTEWYERLPFGGGQS